MAVGLATLAALASSITEMYEKPFANMRDTEKGFLTRVGRKDWPKATYDWLLRDAEYTPVRSIAEADMTKFIDASIFDPAGVGDATHFLLPNAHPFLRPVITMRYNYVTIAVSGLVEDAMGGDPASYVDVVKDESDRATEDLWRALNTQVLSTLTAPNPATNMDGLGVLFNTTASHSYGGVATATYTEWTCAQDTATTSLGIGPMQTMRNKLEGNTEIIAPNGTRRASTIKEWWAAPEQFTAYGNLLTGLRRYNASETLDGGFATLEFYGRKVVEIPNFPSNYLIAYSEKEGGLKHVVLNNLKTDPKSQNIVDGELILMSHKGNFVLTNRTKQGVFNALV